MAKGEDLNCHVFNRMRFVFGSVFLVADFVPKKGFPAPKVFFSLRVCMCVLCFVILMFYVVVCVRVVGSVHNELEPKWWLIGRWGVMCGSEKKSTTI